MGQEVQRILELIEKTILSTMYVSQINGTNPIEVIKEKSMFSNEQIDEQIIRLVEKIWLMRIK